jgi:hypothetical protein
MEENPYQSPVYQSPVVTLNSDRRRIWLTWIALGWVAFLVLSVEAISPSPRSNPTQSFLAFKIITTIFSTIAGFVLIWIPRGYWKAATLPLVGLIIYIQVTDWLWLP